MRLLAHGDPRLYPILEFVGGKLGWELVLAGDGVGERLRAQGIEFSRLEGYITDPVKRLVAERLPAYYANIMESWIEAGACGVLCLEQTDLVAALGGKLGQLVRESLIEEMLLVEAFTACHAERPLDVLCLPDDFPRPFLTLTRVAQKCHVPVLHVAHGVYFHDEGRKDVADAIAVGGWFNKKSLPALGFDSERIFVTGIPAWDYLSALPRALPPATELKRELGVPAHTPLIVYGTTWSENRAWLENLRQGFGALAQALKLAGMADAHLVVKLHPFGDGDTRPYAQAVSSESLPNVTYTTAHKEILLWAADLIVLETASSMMVESTLLGRPVVILMSEEEKRYLFSGIGYPDDALLTSPRDPVRLAGIMEDLLRGGELGRLARALGPRTIEKFNLANDGNATRRVAALLESLAAARRGTTSS